MALTELPNFISALGGYDGDTRTRLALRLMILTFTRTTELRGAQWSEFDNFDDEEPLWRIPAERMKMKLEHIVPLAPQTVTVLRELRALPGSDAKSVPISLPLSRKIHEQQHDALRDVSNGLSRPGDRPRLPNDGLNRTQ